MQKIRRTHSGRTALSSGFTLVELMIVVAMVGVLAALAVVGYKKYIDSSKVSEAVYMVGAIRTAEESFRAETMSYYGASTAWYPLTSAPSSKKVGWPNPAHVDYAMWQALNVTTDGAVRFGYRVTAGQAGAAVPAVSYPSPPTWPNPTVEPWYVIEAQGDPAEKGTFVSVLGHSFSNQISVDNEYQLSAMSVGGPPAAVFCR